MNTSTPPKHRRTVIAIFLLAAFASGAVIAAGSWLGETVRGNGVIRTQERAVSGFKGIALSLPAQVELRMGATESVTVEADENVLPFVETVVRGNVLELRSQKGVNLSSGKLRIVVNAREIEKLAVAGGGAIQAAALKTERLVLDISGNGAITVQAVEAGTVGASIAGSGDVTLAGSARKLGVSIAGSGDVDSQLLRADDVSVSIAGSGDAKVWPVNSLKSSIAGSGDVHYWGDPKANQMKVAGSGDVRRAGAAPR